MEHGEWSVEHGSFGEEFYANERLERVTMATRRADHAIGKQSSEVVNCPTLS